MIKADFRADLIEHIDTQLKELGYTLDEAVNARTNDASYLMLLIRALRRVPIAKPRRVLLATGFAVTAELRDGFANLLQKIESGADIRPWLTTRVADLTKTDKLLDDWGIHHFHLGSTPHPKRQGFVARTEVVAFAVVHPDAIYFLGARSHGTQGARLVWTETKLVDIIHRNWPDLLRTPVLSQNYPVLDAAMHADLRRMHVNAGVTVSDGTVYYPPGGGSLSNGDGFLDYCYQMQLLREIDHKERVVRAHEAQIRAGLSWSEDRELTLKAQFGIAYPDGFKVEIFEPSERIGYESGTWHQSSQPPP